MATTRRLRRHCNWRAMYEHLIDERDYTIVVIIRSKFPSSATATPIAAAPITNMKRDMNWRPGSRFECRTSTDCNAPNIRSLKTSDRPADRTHCRSAEQVLRAGLHPVSYASRRNRRSNFQTAIRRGLLASFERTNVRGRGAVGDIAGGSY